MAAVGSFEARINLPSAQSFVVMVLLANDSIVRGTIVLHVLLVYPARPVFSKLKLWTLAE